MTPPPAPTTATNETVAPAIPFVAGPVISDPVELAYERVLALDDAGQEAIDGWLREADALGSAADTVKLQQRVDERLAEVDAAYEAFLKEHPRHVEARIAYGSFLGDTGREPEAVREWERARALDPRHPAIYNNLAGVFAHRGPITNAFAYLEKAIALKPEEPVYLRNLATAVYLYRKDVMEYYAITNEQQVFDKSLDLYRRALDLDATNFTLATDLAQTYYGIKPLRAEAAIEAWRKAYLLAADELEQQSVRIHLARVLGMAGRFPEARSELDQVTRPELVELRDRVGRSLNQKEAR
jgi:tetratricopeptide (TPR) repeat protein